MERSKETFETYSGLGVALVTPFADNKVDFESLSNIVEHVIVNGVDFIVALGSTGESHLLSEEEQKEVLVHISKTCDNRVPIVGGNFAEISTDFCINRIKSTDLSMVNALMISSPAYVKPSQEGIYRHYMKIAEHTDLPIIIYNVPGRTRSNIEWTTVSRLAKASKKFVGIKEASGDIAQAIHILKNIPSNFVVTSGDDDLSLGLMAHGGHGLISVIANAFPLAMSQMIHSAMSQNFVLASKIQKDMYDFYPLLFGEGNPTGIKSAMKILGFCSNELRLPLVKLSEASYDKLNNLILEYLHMIA